MVPCAMRCQFMTVCKFCDNNLTVEAVGENLNTDHSAYLSLTQKLIDHAIPDAQYSTMKLYRRVLMESSL